VDGPVLVGIAENGGSLPRGLYIVGGSYTMDTSATGHKTLTTQHATSTTSASASTEVRGESACRGDTAWNREPGAENPGNLHIARRFAHENRTAVTNFAGAGGFGVGMRLSRIAARAPRCRGTAGRVKEATCPFTTWSRR
jgi:hypothetical protein